MFVTSLSINCYFRNDDCMMPCHSLQTNWMLRLRLLLQRLQRSKRSNRYGATIAVVLLLSSTYGVSNWLKRGYEEQNRAQKLLRRNSGIRGPDGSRTLFVPYRSRTANVVIYPTKSTTFDAHKRLFLGHSRHGIVPERQILSTVPPPQTKLGLNLAFLHQFLALLSVMIPRWNSKESGLLLSEGAFLMLRTYLSLVVARLDGEIVRDLVAGNSKAFLLGIVKWCGIGGKVSPRYFVQTGI